jgi:hypothetical protein
MDNYNFIPPFSILSLAAILVRPKVCPVIPTSNQDGRQAQNRKRRDEIVIVHCCFSVSQNELKF